MKMKIIYRNFEELINDCSDISIIENIKDDFALKDDIEIGCIKNEILVKFIFCYFENLYKSSSNDRINNKRFWNWNYHKSNLPRYGK